MAKISKAQSTFNEWLLVAEEVTGAYLSDPFARASLLIKLAEKTADTQQAIRNRRTPLPLKVMLDEATDLAETMGWLQDEVAFPFIEARLIDTRNATLFKDVITEIWQQAATRNWIKSSETNQRRENLKSRYFALGLG